MVVLIQAIVTSVQYYELTMPLAIHEMATRSPGAITHSRKRRPEDSGRLDRPREFSLGSPGSPAQMLLPVTQLIGSRLTQLELRGFR